MKKCPYNPDTDVSFNDGYLVISCPNAIEPVLWRMEIGNINETMINIKKVGKNYELNIKTAGDKLKKIAAFETKDAAILVMTRTNQALNQTNKTCHSTMSSPNNDNPHHKNTKKSNKSDVTMAVIGTILIFILIWLIQSPSGNQTTNKPTVNQSTSNNVGQAMSADDFLKSR